jgi:hypothetical protein
VLDIYDAASDTARIVFTRDFLVRKISNWRNYRWQTNYYVQSNFKGAFRAPHMVKYGLPILRKS